MPLLSHVLRLPLTCLNLSPLLLKTSFTTRNLLAALATLGRPARALLELARDTLASSSLLLKEVLFVALRSLLRRVLRQLAEAEEEEEGEKNTILLRRKSCSRLSISSRISRMYLLQEEGGVEREERKRTPSRRALRSRWEVFAHLISSTPRSDLS